MNLMAEEATQPALQLRAGSTQNTAAGTKESSPLTVISTDGGKFIGQLKGRLRTKGEAKISQLEPKDSAPDGVRYGDKDGVSYFLAAEQSKEATRRRIAERAAAQQLALKELSSKHEQLVKANKTAEAAEVKRDWQLLRMQGQLENLNNFVDEYFEEQEKLRETIAHLRKEVETLKQAKQMVP